MRSRLVLLFFSLLVLITISCRKDDLITDSSAKLSFSVDTLVFDTVFTTVGSVTQRIKVFNPHNQNIEISNIFLKEGNASMFRMNVDGAPTRFIEDVLIRANDSIFIFVEVTIDPNGGLTPFVVEDAIVFETNGNVQEVTLVAWGQDAYFYPAVVFPSGGVWALPTDKPNVFYGYGFVDSAATLVIPAGTELFFHEGSGLAVLKGGTLQINGEKGNPVVLQGDRLDEGFDDEPGQWEQVLLAKGSINNVFNYVIIKNAIRGLRVDSASNENPTLVMNSCQILNAAGIGLLGQTARIVANNCVFANCGEFTAALAFGGDYIFNHCTFANYWRFQTRQNGQLFLNNYFIDNEDMVRGRPLNAQFNNCVVYGTQEDEIELDDDKAAGFDFQFDHCVLRTMEDTDDEERYVESRINPTTVFINGVPNDPVFNDPFDLDYSLFEESKARNRGDAAILSSDPILLVDIECNDRNVETPDAGAYQFVPE